VEKYEQNMSYFMMPICSNRVFFLVFLGLVIDE
jgi:hypothetical protein